MIAKTKQYKKIIKHIRKKYKNKWVVNDTDNPITFNSGDLFGSLYHANITVNEIMINGSRYFQAVLYDKYDFKIENYSENFPVKVGNNIAALSQKIGAIVPYGIFIVINTKR